MLHQLFKKEIVDQLQRWFVTGLSDHREIVTQTKRQLVERQEVDIEEGARLVTDEYLFQVLDQGG